MNLPLFVILSSLSYTFLQLPSRLKIIYNTSVADNNEVYGGRSNTNLPVDIVYNREGELKGYFTIEREKVEEIITDKICYFGII